MTATPKSSKCKSCARVLATFSPEGELLQGPSAEGCDNCEQFTALHDAMRAANDAYLHLIDKGDRHRGKQAAHNEVLRTHTEFHNYWAGIEFQEPQNGNLQSEAKEESSSARERTLNKAQQVQQTEETATENKSSESHISQQIPHRLASKRSHSITSVTESKRVKFDQSVEFRDEYRSYEELNRKSKEYVPGRHEPPEEGYLDTSGSGMSAVEFTGEKRVRGGWVEVAPREKKSKKEAAKKRRESQELGSSKDGLAQKDGDRDAQNEEDLPTPSLLGARVTRLRQRIQRLSSADPAQSRDSVTSGDKRGTGGRKRTSLNGAKEKKLDETSGTVSRAPQEGEYDAPISIERLEKVEKPLVELHSTEKDHATRGGEESTTSQPSNGVGSKEISSRSSEANEPQITSTDLFIPNQVSEAPSTPQIEVAQQDHPVAVPNKLSEDDNHGAHQDVQGILSTVQDTEILQGTEQNDTELI